MGWVSGRATLDDQWVWLTAYKFNHGVDPGWAKFQADPIPHLHLGFALKDIATIQLQPWTVGKMLILRLAPQDTVVALRCFGLNEFVNDLEVAIADARRS